MRSGLAGSYPSGVAQFYYSGASAKRIQAAHAAEGGVAAALLAAEGYSGPNDIIEGQGGFARAYADGFKPAADRGGARSALSSDGCAGEIPRGGGAGRRRHRCHAGAARNSTNLPSATSPAMPLGIPQDHPGPADQSASGGPAGGADVPAVQRRAGVEDHAGAGADRDPRQLRTTRPGLKDRSLHELEERTTIALDDEVEAASNELSTAARVSVTLRDGRTLSRLVPAPKGQPVQPIHRRRSTRRGSRRSCRAACSEKVCGEIIAMSRDLDRLDPRWLGRVLSGA